MEDRHGDNAGANECVGFKALIPVTASVGGPFGRVWKWIPVHLDVKLHTLGHDEVKGCGVSYNLKLTVVVRWAGTACKTMQTELMCRGT